VTVILRPWRAADAAIVREAAGELLMDRQLGPVHSLREARRWIAEAAADRENGTRFAFAVLNDNGDPVGNVAVSSVDVRHLTGWVSYWILGRCRGQGLATRACREVSRCAFEEQGLFRLELGHRLDNPASCRVALAAGFAVEGVERAKLLYDGMRYDVERHARLATDRAGSVAAESDDALRRP
jgi:RimJ/RimL family protein N-acetyltransferase